MTHTPFTDSVVFLITGLNRGGRGGATAFASAGVGFAGLEE